MAFVLLMFVLCLGASFNRTLDARTVPSGKSAGFGYELLMAALEDFKFRTQEDIQDSKNFTLKVNSNVENVQKSLSDNKQMLADQRKNIDELENKISQLLTDTSKIIEAQQAQQIFNNIILASFAYGKRLLETCCDLQGRGSGIQMLKPGLVEHFGGFLAYCDQDYEGGGWTVIQNRFDGGVNFYRGWKDYEKGFGDLEGEYWLGLKNLHHLTNARPHELHVVLEDFEGKRVVAKYSHMVVGSAEEKYSLKKLGNYSGDAGDSLSYSLNMNFSTFDADNDLDDRNCAVTFLGAWWYKTCHASNLNGWYVKGESQSYANMVCWLSFKGFNYGLKSSRMMIRATD